MRFDPGTFSLVFTEWLTAHLDDPDIRVVDVRWRSRYENGRGISFDDYEGYVAGHIPGAVFAGMIADLSDPHHRVSDMLVGPEQFARVMGRLGSAMKHLSSPTTTWGFPLAPRVCGGRCRITSMTASACSTGVCERGRRREER